ncbi:GtrA family protein [Plantactinospora sp. CA-290183]|uniref:GtrA family protein n=1 Tax=Plantactinospora sp. CA-290183 TaxID=3240006 RepID=UPI003D941725
MRFVRLLPERWQRLLQEVLKFGAVGGINAVVNYTVFNTLALTVFVDGQLKANVIATVVATCTSYLLNRHWTYRDRPKSAMRRETALFFLFNATGLAIELGVLAVAKYGLGISGLFALNVAKTVGVGLATIFRFWSYRTFVFQKAAAPSASDAPTPGPGTTPGPTPAADTGGRADSTDGAGTSERPAALDPVAELAEAVAEFTEADPERAPATPAPRAATGTQPGDRAAKPSVEPLEEQFAAAIDVALEAELAAELNAANRRSPAR